MRRGVIGVGCLIVVLLLASPAVYPREIDSMPVSNYPMFAHPRPATTRFNVAVLLGESGEQRRLDAFEVGGTDQPMQAAMTLQQAITAHASMQLCQEIASRLQAPGLVELMTVEYDAIDWFRGERTPLATQVQAECHSNIDP